MRAAALSKPSSPARASHAAGAIFEPASAAVIGLDGTVFVASAMFHHDDRIGALGKRRAGHDLDRFARLDDAFESFAGAHFADDANAPGHVTGTDREAIPHGAVEWRIIAVGGYVLRQNARPGNLRSKPSPVAGRNAAGTALPAKRPRVRREKSEPARILV